MRATASGLDGLDFAAAELIQSVPFTSPAIATDAMNEAHKPAKAAPTNRMAFPPGRGDIRRAPVGGMPAPPAMSLSAPDPSGMSPAAPERPGRRNRN